MKEHDKNLLDLYAGLAMLGTMPIALQERWTTNHIAWSSFELAKEMMRVRARILLGAQDENLD